MWNYLRNHSRWLAFVWTLFISVLFFMPGSALPKSDWLDQILFDKWVHIGFFAVLLFLWKFSFWKMVKANGALLAAAAAYGLGVELIQHFLVANRSFNGGDLAADVVGAWLGLAVWDRYKKNRPL